jgi:glycosyltransferase involved in cell wall biosynthesis
MNSVCELTVLMPCLNESRTVQSCVRSALRYLETARIDGEVLISDNGSTDGSVQLAEAAGARVVHAPARGYGAALQMGIREARGSFIIIGDADCSYDFSALDGFVQRLRGGAQLVMGNRFKGEIKPGAMPFLHRYLGNPVLSAIGRLFFRIPISDFHCGLRGFSREAILQLGLVTQGMEFASEMVAKAALAKLRIEETPTTLSPDGRDRPPHLRTWRDGWRHLRFLLLFCPRWLFLYPGLILMLMGTVGFAGLAMGPVALSSFTLDIHSMLYMSAAMVLGTQLVQLAFLTKWVGVLSGVVPSPPWLERSKGVLTLEAGLLVGVLMFLCGMAVSLALLFQWGNTGFGALDPREVMRRAIPATTLMLLGMQIAAVTLFAGALYSCWTSFKRSPA